MNPNICKENFSSVLGCDTLFTRCQNGYLRELVDDHKNTIMTMFGGLKPSYVIHGYGLPGIFWCRERSVQPMLLNRHFSDGTGSARPNVLADIMSNIGPIEMLLK
jgi:hypothetical protein